jgi:uncharacterized membrane protein YkvA (DUF1232 family)
VEWWQIALIVLLSGLVSTLVAGFVLWRRASRRTRQLASRIGNLSWSDRFLLARRLLQDERFPPHVRLIPPLLVLYLALPIDLVPDFIPVLGQLDDVAVAIVGIALLSRYVPVQIIEGHIAALEGPS